MSKPWEALANKVHAKFAEEHEKCEAGEEECTPDVFGPHWLTAEEVRQVLLMVSEVDLDYSSGPEDQEPEEQPVPEAADEAPKSDDDGAADSGDGDTPAEATPGGSAPGKVASPVPNKPDLSAILKALRESADRREFDGQKGAWKPGPETQAFQHTSPEAKAKNVEHQDSVESQHIVNKRGDGYTAQYQGVCSCGWQAGTWSSSIGVATQAANRHATQMYALELEQGVDA